MRNSQQSFIRVLPFFMRPQEHKKNAFEKKVAVLLLRYFSHRCRRYERWIIARSWFFAVEGINAKPAHLSDISNSTIVLCHWCVISLVKKKGPRQSHGDRMCSLAAYVVQIFFFFTVQSLQITSLDWHYYVDFFTKRFSQYFPRHRIIILSAMLDLNKLEASLQLRPLVY